MSISVLPEAVPVNEGDFPDDIGGEDPGEGEMDLFAVCWRSSVTPAKVRKGFLQASILLGLLTEL